MLSNFRVWVVSLEMVIRYTLLKLAFRPSHGINCLMTLRRIVYTHSEAEQQRAGSSLAYLAWFGAYSWGLLDFQFRD